MKIFDQFSMKGLISYLLQSISFAFISATCFAQTPNDCPGCNLTGRDFSGQNLQNVNFSGAILDNTNFQNTNLSGTYFSGASLQNANFQNATMGTTLQTSTVFSLTNLLGANFTGASIGASIFYHANISNANFSNTNLSNAQFGLPPTISPQNAVNTIMPKPSVKNTSVALPAGTSIYVNGTTGVDNSGCGAISTPCQSIQQGINNCVGPCNVMVEYGQYLLTSSVHSLTLKSNVNLIGGCVNGLPTYYQTSVTSYDGYYAAVFSQNVNSVTIANFIFNAAPTQTTNVATMVMQLNNSKVSLSNVSINASQGGLGINGSGANTGINGGAGGTGSNNQSGGTGLGGVGGTSQNNPNNRGGNGGNQTSATSTCSGFFQCSAQATYTGTNMDGAKGNPGSTSNYANGSSRGSAVIKLCTGWFNSSPSQNSPGSAGNNGTCGATNTSLSITSGSFLNGIWNGDINSNGITGGAGGGGGGGGGGEVVLYCDCVCSNPDQHAGTGGGGGGAGGEGALGGGGGYQGGASIGILLYVSTLTFNENVKVVGGAGGNGGTGGNGNKGGTGGSGGSGGATNNIGGKGGTGGQGGTGGSGGAGGSSSGGAGGNGGPSIGVALVANAQGNPSSIVNTPTYYNGKGGNGGAGGGGGVATVSGACSGNTGASGIDGNVLSTAVFTSR